MNEMHGAGWIQAPGTWIIAGHIRGRQGSSQIFMKKVEKK